MTVRHAIFALAIAAIVGCDDAAAPAPAAQLPQPTYGNATITGRVRFVGTPPERKVIDISTCQEGSRVYQEETIVVGEGGGLRDVVVYLRDAPPTDGSTGDPAVLDQVGCRYTPHVLAVQVNQPVRITTSDAAFHNVHLTNMRKDDVNVGMRSSADAVVERFADANTFVLAKCDVHPWMRAHIAVIGSPFFGVTSADGSFVIDRVPAGKHALAVWHPILGQRESSVEVAADGTATLDIDFAPPKSP